MCWWIFGHCWHKIEHNEHNEIKIRNDRCKCARQDPFTYYDMHGSYAMVRKQEECCLCGKRRYYIVCDYDPLRWKLYTTPEDKNYNIYWG